PRRADRNPGIVRRHAEGTRVAPPGAIPNLRSVRPAHPAAGWRGRPAVLRAHGRRDREAHGRGPHHVVGVSSKRGGRRDAVSGLGGCGDVAPDVGVDRADLPLPAPSMEREAMTRTGGEARRRLLLEEAVRQFGNKGYDGASLESVASACGVRKQTLLYYFPTKDALFEACVIEVSARVALALTEALAEEQEPSK